MSCLQLHLMNKEGKAFGCGCFLNWEARERWNYVCGDQLLPWDRRGFEKLIGALSVRFVPPITQEKLTAELRRLRQSRLSIERYMRDFNLYAKMATHWILLFCINGLQLIFLWPMISSYRRGIWKGYIQLTDEGGDNKFSDSKRHEKSHWNTCGWEEDVLQISKFSSKSLGYWNSHIESFKLTVEELTRTGTGMHDGHPQNYRNTRSCHFCELQVHLQKTVGSYKIEVTLDYYKQKTKQDPKLQRAFRETDGPMGTPTGGQYQKTPKGQICKHTAYYQCVWTPNGWTVDATST